MQDNEKAIWRLARLTLIFFVIFWWYDLIGSGQDSDSFDLKIIAWGNVREIWENKHAFLKYFKAPKCTTGVLVYICLNHLTQGIQNQVLSSWCSTFCWPRGWGSTVSVASIRMLSDWVANSVQSSGDDEFPEIRQIYIYTYIYIYNIYIRVWPPHSHV